MRNLMLMAGLLLLGGAAQADTISVPATTITLDDVEPGSPVVLGPFGKVKLEVVGHSGEDISVVAAPIGQEQGAQVATYNTATQSWTFDGAPEGYSSSTFTLRPTMVTLEGLVDCSTGVDAVRSWKPIASTGPRYRTVWVPKQVRVRE